MVREEKFSLDSVDGSLDEVSRCTSPRGRGHADYSAYKDDTWNAYLVAPRQSIYRAFEDYVTSPSGRIFPRVEVT